MNRRQFIQHSFSIPVIAGLAGCTGNEPTGGDGNEAESPTSTSDTETESSTPTPDAEWKQNMPRCSSGDHEFKVRGVKINNNAGITVSIENIGVEAYEPFRIGVEYRDTLGTEYVSKFIDTVIQGGESVSFEFDVGSVEAVLEVDVDESAAAEGGEFDTCW